MSNPTSNSQVQFKYIKAGASLPNPLDNNTIYFDENTQRLIASGVSIYNPIVYNADPQPGDPIISPPQVLISQDEYDALKESGEVDEGTLYLIYREDIIG